MRRLSKDIKVTLLCCMDSMNCVGIEYLYNSAQVFIVLGGRDSPTPTPLLYPSAYTPSDEYATTPSMCLGTFAIHRF